jgi:hypothetical protein
MKADRMSQDIMMIAAQEIQLKSTLRSSNLNIQRPGSVTLQRTSVGGQSFSQGRGPQKKMAKINRQNLTVSLIYINLSVVVDP